MKDLSKYILESEADGKNGHYEYKTDSNGKGIKIWVDYDEIVKQRKAAEAAIKAAKEEKLKKKEEKRKAAQELEDSEDRMIEINGELSDLEQQHRDLMIDMEEELGPLYAQHTKEGEAEAEKRAQDYGEQFNKIEKQIEKLNKEYDDLDKKCNELIKKWNL